MLKLGKYYLISCTKKIAASSLLYLCIVSVVAENGYQEIIPSNEKILLAQEIFTKIDKEHYFKNTDLKNIHSQQINALLDLLDERKIYFTSREVSSFQNSEASTSDQIDVEPLYALVNLYFRRLIEVTEYQLRLMEKGKFYFSSNDELDIFNEDNEWKRSILNLRQIWRKMAKNDLLNSMLSDKNQSEALEVIKKRYSNRLKRIIQRNEEDVFSIVMNNLTSLYDPHSSYLSPKSAEDFEMAMSLKLDGIGALLTTEDDYPTIVSVVPGGPAEKSGKINPKDRIVKIKQMHSINIPAVDVVGWRIDEVVQLIRGDKGSQVQLELIPANTEDLSERKIVVITRDEVKLEEQAAKSEIVEISYQGVISRIGIIDLPAFYIDFKAWRESDPNFRSSSNDIAKILQDFNQKNVDGLIIDLRGNSGGSLYEANKLTGLFVAAGATVQVKESSGSIRPWGDRKAKQAWQKPMSVLVDRYSASASEIFAAAIQDYQRGIIVGHQTYGKGTVQKLDDLSDGQIKLTESKFYRITGSGTQNKGVTPDVILPATWDINEIGESSLLNALAWDEVQPLRFKSFKIGPNIVEKLNNLHVQRRANNPNLRYLADIRERYNQQKNKKQLSLNIGQRKLEKNNRQQWALKTENRRRVDQALDIFKSYEDYEKFNEDKDVGKINLDDDYLLEETSNIMRDFIMMSAYTQEKSAA